MTDAPAANRDPLLEPSEDRLPADEPGRAQLIAAHAAAVRAGALGYIDPDSGLFVMTALALLQRGTCCENGCRHCPYVE